MAPSPVTEEDDRDDRGRVLELLREHGWNTTSFQVLERGFSYWFDDTSAACVAYVDTGGAWVAAGAPIASESDLASCADRFVAAARRAGRRACFFAVEERLATSPLLASMPIGEQPAWDPTRWRDVVGADRRLREQLRRARAKGVSVRVASSSELEEDGTPLRTAIEELVARWLDTRKMAPMGFIVDVQPFDFANERRCVVAEREGRVVGVLVAVPVYRRSGWLFEDVLRAPDAPNGTTELLIDRAMQSVANEGSQYVTLGLAPLAGDVSKRLGLARALTRALYDFDGVRRFKAKLRPESWTPIYIAWPRGESGNFALVDALAAFTMRPRDGRDRASFVRFGIETLTHSPAAGVRLLAMLLVPWTIALATAAAARFFPSSSVQIAWVVFDVAVCIAMLSLAKRWRAGLAKALALATSIDALLSVFELVTDGLHRARGPLDVAVMIAACTGPVLATSLLWGALVTPKRLRAARNLAQKA